MINSGNCAKEYGPTPHYHRHPHSLLVCWNEIPMPWEERCMNRGQSQKERSLTTLSKSNTNERTISSCPTMLEQIMHSTTSYHHHSMRSLPGRGKEKLVDIHFYITQKKTSSVCRGPFSLPFLGSQLVKLPPTMTHVRAKAKKGDLAASSLIQMRPKLAEFTPIHVT